MPLITLKRRAEFLRIRGGARWSTPYFVVEGKRRLRGDGEAAGAVHGGISQGIAGETQHPHFGFTVTKKLGCAVVRNRIRRRLREIVRKLTQTRGLPDCDYVIVARESCLRCPAEQLQSELDAALRQVDRKLAAARR